MLSKSRRKKEKIDGGNQMSKLIWFFIMEIVLIDDKRISMYKQARKVVSIKLKKINLGI